MNPPSSNSDFPRSGTRDLRSLPVLRSSQVRRARDHVTVATAAALGLGLLLGGGGWALTARGTGCDGPSRWLSVTVDPAIAPAALAAAERFNRARKAAGRCDSVKVMAGDSGEAANVFRSGRATPDVWIPDSSLWTDLAGQKGTFPSVASSPIVFALPETAAKRRKAELKNKSWKAFQPSGQSVSASFQLRLLDPEHSGAGMATLLALETASGTGEGHLARFTAMLRTAKTIKAGQSMGSAFGEDGDLGGTAVATVSEQAALQYHRSANAKAARVEIVYPSTATPYLDFPFVVATSNSTQKQVAQKFLAELRSTQGLHDLQQADLRRALNGGKVPNAATAAGTEPARPVDAPQGGPAVMPVIVPNAAARIRLIWSRLGQGLNAMALIDPSRAASTPMPGGTGNGRPPTRLSSMLNALSTGFNVVPDGTGFGLSALSGDPRRPYRQVLAMDDVGARTPNGGNHRLRLQDALKTVGPRPRSDGSGMYSAIRAAYHEVERNYEEGKLNVVIVLTAGEPLGREGTEFNRTVKELKDAFDPQRPVSVIVLGFGQPAAPELQKVADVTDGGLFKIDDRPETVMRLFLRSDQLRVCDNARCPD